MTKETAQPPPTKEMVDRMREILEENAQIDFQYQREDEALLRKTIKEYESKILEKEKIK